MLEMNDKRTGGLTTLLINNTSLLVNVILGNNRQVVDVLYFVGQYYLKNN